MHTELTKADNTMKGKAIVAATLLLFVASAIFPADAFAAKHVRRSKVGAQMQQMKISPELLVMLQNTSPTTPVKIIVQFRYLPNAAEYAKVKALGGKLSRRLQLIRGGAFTVPLFAVRYIASFREVAYVSLDRQVRMSLDYVTRAVNADIAQSYGFTGAGVGVAVIDSGVYAHPDFLGTDGASRVVYGESFVPADAGADDAYGHGTHVAGIIAGSGQSSVTGYVGHYTGIAPQSNIIDLRVLDANGSGADSTVIAAIQRAVQLKGVYNIRVLNLSLGRGVYESYALDPLCQAVEQAWNAGIVVVVAAGNSGRDNSNGTHGYGTIAAPANDPYVITVGAMNMHNTYDRSDDTIASYSSKGPSLIDHVVKPDIVAPGNRVVSALDPNGALENTYPQFDVFPCDATTGVCNASVGAALYYRLSGTSMAAPAVSGAAALMLQADPTLTPDLIKARLMKTAYKMLPKYSGSVDENGNPHANQFDVFTYGAGYLDIAAALQNTDTGTGLALSPGATIDTSTGVARLVFGDSVIWGSSVIWGDSVIWGGDSLVDGLSVIWGGSAIWEDSTAEGYSVIWGDSVIWGGFTDNEAFSPAISYDCTGDASVDPPACTQ